jgi:transposase
MSGHISGDKIVVVETRRRWTDEERQRALNDTLAASVSSVARQHGIAKSLLFRWRKEAGLSGKRGGAKKPSASFVPVALLAPLAVAETTASSSPRTADRGLIEIELAGGRMVRVTGAVETEALKRVIAVLEGR